MVRVGLVGTGWIGQRHLESLARMADVRVVGVCDVDRSKAEAQAGRWGLPVFTDYDRMLAEGEPEAVVICTPPTVRLELVKAAAEKGIHCFIEKPPAKTLAAAQEVQAVLDQTGVINSVGFMYRYCKAVDRVKELIAGRRVALVHSRLLCVLAMDPNWPRWFFDKQRSGGPIIDQAIHSLDLSRYILGEVAQVVGFGANGTVPKGGDFTVEDSHSLALRYRSGVLQNHCHSWAYPDYVSTMEFLSDELHLHLDVVNSRLQGRLGDAKVSFEYAGDNAYRTELEAFVAAVGQGRRDLVRSTYADAVQTLKLTLAAYDSVEGAGVVSLGGDR